VLKQLDIVGGHPHQHDVGCGDQNFVLVKEPFLDQPLVFLENVALCPIGVPIGKGDIFAYYRPVFLHISSNSGNNIRSLLGFPWHWDGAGC
jgi:hypothetical protein